MKKKITRSIGALSLLFGVSILGYTLLPIATYEIRARVFYPSYLSPVPEGSAQNSANTSLESDSSQVSIDYTNATNWFEGGLGSGTSYNSKIRFYTISVPKLNIKDAVVSLGGEDLSESLIQYPGTAAPGKVGNGVIFGHSILPQYYDPENYLSIFSLLPDLSEGDKIEINYDGITYNYEVEDMFEVRPTDVYILEQNETEPHLSLVTCTPPGHPLRPKRLVVRAKLLPPEIDET